MSIVSEAYRPGQSGIPLTYPENPQAGPGSYPIPHDDASCNGVRMNNNTPTDRLVRPVEGRMVAGVALGTAHRLGIEPWIARLGFLILSLFGGAGLLLYIAGWLLIPEEGTTESIAEDWIGSARENSTWIGAAIVVIAAAILVGNLHIVRGDILWAVGLLAFGVLLYQGRLPEITGRAESTSASGDEVVTEPEAETAENVEEGDPGVAEVPTEVAATTETSLEAPPARRERSMLGRLTIGTLFIAVGVLLAVDTVASVNIRFGHYVALLIGVVGIGLLVGTFLGRSRGLIVLGVLLVPVALVASVVTASFDGGFGNPDFAPRLLTEVDRHYELTAGDLTIDLRSLDVDGQELSVEGDLGFGHFQVLLPDGVGYRIEGHVGFGDIDFDGVHHDGVDVDGTWIRPGSGTIVLDLDVGFGQLEIDTGNSR